MKTREYRVWFSINVELPEDADPQEAYRAAEFSLKNNKPQPYRKSVYFQQYVEEVVWYRYHDTAIRRWDKYGFEKDIDTQIARNYKYRRERAAKYAKEEAEKLKQQVQESAPGIAP